MIKKNKPNSIGANLIEIVHIDKRKNKIKLFFEKNTLEFKGWTTKDAYSNDVHFIINNLKVNNEIADSFLKFRERKIFKE